MDLIVWRDYFNTGVEKIDTQHKQLAKLINDLFNALGTKQNEDTLKGVFTELYSYTINHFTAEEALMLERHSPDFEKHKEEHKKFINKVNEFKEKYFRGDAKVTVEILNFLKDWLLDHIAGVDKKAFAPNGK